MKKILLIMMALVMAISVEAQKREMRGAWIQCVNGQFQGIGKQRMQQTLSAQLDELQKDGVNLIIFQVRPECDALYESKIEPWSRFLTGQQGVAPSPYWDPLQWMITECHKRGMELHAWINPYRAKTKGTRQLAQNHIAVQRPMNCFAYDGQFILNPGIAENRDYICSVVKDIVSRYDIDGLHMDDYFYPYPVKGETIPDDELFHDHPNGIKDQGDWRRYNVNLFIEQVYKTVHQTKPWVKVGISPFGIYRNRSTSYVGSNTNGTQNYDDLYADVLMWVNNGWLDYCVPQLYWEIGHKAADYETVHQQAAKMALHRQMPNVQGTVLWYAKAAVDNIGNYGHNLRNVYWRYPALQPEMPFIDNKAPKKVSKLKPIWTEDGYVLFWTAPNGDDWKDKAEKYVVYRFRKGERQDYNNPANIFAITQQPFVKLPYENGSQKWVYAVTALDRLQNESKAVKTKVKL